MNISLSDGTHSIELKDIAANCSVSGSNPVRMNTEEQLVKEIEFDVVCKEILVNKVVMVSNQEGPLDLYIAEPNDKGSGFTNYRRHTHDDYPEQHPTISTDGTQIAFTKQGNIWMIDANGGNEKQITSSGEDFKPVWLAEQNKLAFTSRRDGKAQIYTINADGSQEQRFESTNPLYTGSTTASSNPLYTGNEKRRNSEFDLSGVMMEGDLSKIVLIKLEEGGKMSTKTLTKNTIREFAPAWSPDGSIVTSIIENARGVLNLQSIEVETGEILGTTNFQVGFIDSEASPSWVPDGSALLFSSIKSSSVKAKGAAQDYNSSRSNKPSPIREIETDETGFTVMYVAWSRILKW
ncbi:MAG: hypothetical protein WC967_06635 [Balneolaceae bacterium]